MGNFKSYYSFFLAFFLCFNAISQDKWSLERCITHAIENNLQVKQQEIEIQQAQNNFLQSQLEFIPSVNASVNHNMSWGRSVNLNDLEITENVLSQSSSMNLSASIPLFEGMQKHNKVKSNIKQLEMAITNTEKLKDEISLSIAREYLQILLSYEIIKSTQEIYNSTVEQVSRTQNLVDAGSLAYSSLLEIKSQLANEKFRLVEAQNSYRSNLLNLAQLLNLDDVTCFDIEIPNVEYLVVHYTEDNASEIFNHAQSLPVIRGAELAKEESRLQYKIQKGAALPIISFSAGYGTYYSDNQKTSFFRQFDNNRNPSVGIGLSIPVFNNWKTNTAIKNAKLNMESSEINLEIARQNLMKEIQQACNEANSCYQKFIAAKQNVESARETFKNTKEKFEIGILNGTDYSVTKANLLKAESELLQSKYQYIFQLKVLDYYRCNPITL